MLPTHAETLRGLLRSGATVSDLLTAAWLLPAAPDVVAQTCPTVVEALDALEDQHALSASARKRSIGHRPYGMVYLVVNTFKARGFALRKMTPAMVIDALTFERVAHVDKSVVEFAGLSSKQQHRILRRIIGVVIEISTRGRGVDADDYAHIVKDVMRFVSHRNRWASLIDHLSERGHDHMVIYPANSNMTQATTDFVMGTLYDMAGKETMGFYVDYGRMTHFHVIGATDLQERLYSKLVRKGHALQVRGTPTSAKDYWELSCAPRDTASYLAAKGHPYVLSESKQADFREHRDLFADPAKYGGVFVHRDDVSGKHYVYS